MRWPVTFAAGVGCSWWLCFFISLPLLPSLANAHSHDLEEGSRRLTGASTTNTTEEVAAEACEPGGGGLLMPFISTENEWPKMPRAFMYFMGLCWCFLGVSIIADIFMGAIEAVTSRRKTITISGDRKITVKVWNDTVANLTLMALGSSAPEILLNVIEILGAEFKAGELGPGTIVGSAAFNLLVIIAVCVYVIPEGEKRTIKSPIVFLITATSSVLAYVWLIVILAMSSPDMIEPWEGILTFLFFPLLAFVAYLADIGKFNCGVSKVKHEEAVREMAMRHGITEDDLGNADLAKALNEREVPSRAKRRMDATAGTRSGRTQVPPQDCSVGFISTNDTHVKQGTSALHLEVQKYGRNARDKSIAIQYKITRASEKDKNDYYMEIPAGDLSNRIEVGKVHEEVGQEIFVQIVSAVLLKPNSQIQSKEEYERAMVNLNSAVVFVMPELTIAKAIVMDSTSTMGTGQLRFERPEVEHTPDAKDETILALKVQRFNGFDGQIMCRYHTKAGSARAGGDYIETSGELVFWSGVTEMEIKVRICNKASWEAGDSFYVDLLELEDSDGEHEVIAKDGNICTVNITESLNNGDLAGKMGRLLDSAINLDATREGNAEWWEQLQNALRPVPGDDEDSQAATAKDWLIHFIALPWKLLFALVPPTSYCGGWSCFSIALVMIGGVTAIIGDLANLMGCCLGLPAGITAITIVALGTSLPDTFASKTAAVEDPTADAAIGNVTGSNSVNVFLGLGLPWMIGALYWDSAGPTEQWIKWYPELYKTYPSGGFVVMAGDLTFSVMIFTFCALTALGVIGFRRRAFQAELGGPSGVKTNTSIFLVLLWFFYVALASWKMIVKEQGTTDKCIAAVCVGIAALVFFQVVVSGILHCASGSMSKQAKAKKDLEEAVIAGVAAKIVDNVAVAMNDSNAVVNGNNNLYHQLSRRSLSLTSNFSKLSSGPADVATMREDLKGVRAHVNDLSFLIDRLDAALGDPAKQVAQAENTAPASSSSRDDGGRQYEAPKSSSAKADGGKPLVSKIRMSDFGGDDLDSDVMGGGAGSGSQKSKSKKRHSRQKQGPPLVEAMDEAIEEGEVMADTANPVNDLQD